MNDISEKLERFKEMVLRFDKSSDSVTKADTDELLVMMDYLGENLPPRVIALKGNIEGYDEDYPGVYSNLWPRILRLLDAYESYPVRLSADTDIDANPAPTFSLPNDDKTRMFELCSQMRKIVLNAPAFDQPHKRLLLDRIAAIEYQVEQPKGYLDIVRGGISDVGETLGKFGTDIEPLTKRMKEVFGIARRGSKAYDQIPAPEEIKQIEDQSDNTGEE